VDIKIPILTLKVGRLKFPSEITMYLARCCRVYVEEKFAEGAGGRHEKSEKNLNNVSISD
jgi:hypothetical protein